jgi:hypothetical protein
MAIGAAFVVPVGYHNGSKYLYFGVERNTKEASAFGGKRDKNETVHRCAIRELREESHGVFIKDKTAAKKLGNQTKHHVHAVKIHNVTMGYFLPVKPHGNPIKRFAAENSKKGLPKHKKEMTKVLAVKAQDVIKMVNTTAPGAQMSIQGHKVRPLLGSMLRQAVNAKYI